MYGYVTLKTIEALLGLLPRQAFAAQVRPLGGGVERQVSVQCIATVFPLVLPRRSLAVALDILAELYLCTAMQDCHLRTWVALYPWNTVFILLSPAIDVSTHSSDIWLLISLDAASGSLPMFSQLCQPVVNSRSSHIELFSGPVTRADEFETLYVVWHSSLH
jgi:hypothetical protein